MKTKRFKNIVFLVIVLSIFSVFFINNTYSKGISNEYSFGNTMGNITNGGMVAGDEDSLCYSLPFYQGNQSEGDIPSSLNKINVFNTKNKAVRKVNNDVSGMLNLYKNWIFYRSYSDSDYGSIFKVGIDGSNRKRLVKCSFDNYQKNNIDNLSMIVYNDKIIYLDNVDYDGKPIYSYFNKLFPCKLKIVDLNGTNSKILCDLVYQINVSENWIYYTAFDKNSINLYKIKPNGSEKKEISREQIIQFIVAKEDKSIYYLKFSESNIGELWKMDLEGNNREKILDYVSNFNIYNNEIYCCYKNESIIKLRNNGEKITIVSKKGYSFTNINVANNIIHCLASTTTGFNQIEDYFLTSFEYIRIEIKQNKIYEVNNVFKDTAYLYPEKNPALFDAYFAKNSQERVLYPNIWSLYKDNRTRYISFADKEEYREDAIIIGSLNGFCNGEIRFYKDNNDLYKKIIDGFIEEHKYINSNLNEEKLPEYSNPKYEEFKTFEGFKLKLYTRNYITYNNNTGCFLIAYISNGKRVCVYKIDINKTEYTRLEKTIIYMLKKVSFS